MFKVTVINGDRNYAAMEFPTQEAAQNYILRNKHKWGPGADGSIEDLTAERAAEKQASDALKAKRVAAKQVLKNTNPQSVNDPVLRAVVELLQ